MTKITGLTEQTEAPADGDLIEIVDVSDTSMAGTGTNKKIPVSTLFQRAGMAPSKVLIEEIENTTAGEFDFNNIPQTFDRLIIEGELRGDVVATTDAAYIFFNADTTVANYHYQQTGSFDGNNSVFGEGATPKFHDVPADSAPSGAHASIRVVVENYTGSAKKSVTSQYGVEYGTDTQATGQYFTSSAVSWRPLYVTV